MVPRNRTDGTKSSNIMRAKAEKESSSGLKDVATSKGKPYLPQPQPRLADPAKGTPNPPRRLLFNLFWQVYVPPTAKPSPWFTNKQTYVTSTEDFKSQKAWPALARTHIEGGQGHNHLRGWAGEWTWWRPPRRKLWSSRSTSPSLPSSLSLTLLSSSNPPFSAMRIPPLSSGAPFATATWRRR